MTVASELEALRRIRPSRIGSHAAPCCVTARHAITSRIQRHTDLASRLAAVPKVISWRPIAWPAYWCDIASGDEFGGDCGVHADVASRLLAREGIEHARGRIAVSPGEQTAAHWRAFWHRNPDAWDGWIGPTLSHHEVICIRGRWWDPTEARWFSGPGATLEAGHVVALRDESGDWLLECDLPIGGCR